MLKILAICVGLATGLAFVDGAFQKVKHLPDYLLRLAHRELEQSDGGELARKMIGLANAQTQPVPGSLAELFSFRPGTGVDPPPSGSDIDIPPLLSSAESESQLQELQNHENFKKFVSAYGKAYATEEEYNKRYGIFKKNMKKAQFLTETERGTATYGASPLADLTEDEFRKQKLGWKFVGDVPDWPEADIPDVRLPANFDWRDFKAVTPVKNQGSCGSCWAFSVTGNVEGQWKLRRGKLLSLSEQELVDCDKYDHGCEGGLPANAYEAIKEIGGLEQERDYEYEGDDETCHFSKSKVRAVVTGGLKISTNETQMAQWLMKNGPISIGLNANAMQFYMGGVSHPWKFLCSPESLDHGVLIVGFGVHHYPALHKTIPFWIVKNSWGTGWGEKGYYRVYRGDGTCGLNMMASTATVAKN